VIWAWSFLALIVPMITRLDALHGLAFFSLPMLVIHPRQSYAAE
jgi:hypothetical protein